jgi:hypothetical protein
MGYLEHDGADVVAHRAAHAVLDEEGLPLPQVKGEGVLCKKSWYFEIELLLQGQSDGGILEGNGVSFFERRRGEEERVEGILDTYPYARRLGGEA